MNSVIFIRRKGSLNCPDIVFDPNSKVSLEEFSDDVLDALRYSNIVPMDIEFEDWVKHPAYIATVTASFDILKNWLKQTRYEFVEISVVC